jgi:putative nucleotidyltransferase with HDIG domain
MEDNITGEVVKRAEALARSIADNAGYTILSRDFLSLDNMVYKMRGSNPDVEQVVIADKKMNILAHSEIVKIGTKYEEEPGRVLRSNPDGSRVQEITGVAAGAMEIIVPIRMANREVGMVALRVNRSVLQDALHAARIRTIKLFILILLAGIAGSIALSQFLTRPIKELSDGVEELKKGNGERRLTVYSQDELGRLTERFNEMTSIITRQHGRLADYARELEGSSLSTVQVLAAAIDARDPYTHGHSARVSRYSVLLGRELGLDKRELEDLQAACLFHDVGKIRTPDAILRKRGKLDDWEYKQMKRHPEDGAAILAKAPLLHKYIPAVRHHHERFNGTGYPAGLKGDDIPLFSSIIAVVDTYDAMTSNRPYRDARTLERTVDELLSCSGTQFNPDVVAAFMRTLDKIIAEPPIMPVAELSPVPIMES